MGYKPIKSNQFLTVKTGSKGNHAGVAGPSQKHAHYRDITTDGYSVSHFGDTILLVLPHGHLAQAILNYLRSRSTPTTHINIFFPGYDVPDPPYHRYPRSRGRNRGRTSTSQSRANSRLASVSDGDDEMDNQDDDKSEGESNAGSANDGERTSRAGKQSTKNVLPQLRESVPTETYLFRDKAHSRITDQRDVLVQSARGLSRNRIIKDSIPSRPKRVENRDEVPKHASSSRNKFKRTQERRRKTPSLHVALPDILDQWQTEGSSERTFQEHSFENTPLLKKWASKGYGGDKTLKSWLSEASSDTTELSIGERMNNASNFETRGRHIEGYVRPTERVQCVSNAGATVRHSAIGTRPSTSLLANNGSEVFRIELVRSQKEVLREDRVHSADYNRNTYQSKISKTSTAENAKSYSQNFSSDQDQDVDSSSQGAGATDKDSKIFAREPRQISGVRSNTDNLEFDLRKSTSIPRRQQIDETVKGTQSTMRQSTDAQPRELVHFSIPPKTTRKISENPNTSENESLSEKNTAIECISTSFKHVDPHFVDLDQSQGHDPPANSRMQEISASAPIRNKHIQMYSPRRSPGQNSSENVPKTATKLKSSVNSPTSVVPATTVANNSKGAIPLAASVNKSSGISSSGPSSRGFKAVSHSLPSRKTQESNRCCTILWFVLPLPKWCI